MSHDEFSLIRQYFTDKAEKFVNPDIVLGIGDDAAVINVPANHHLVSTMDTLVAGRHFPVQTRAQDVAYKSLAVNVSDLAAMAATPGFFLLSLTLPEADDSFLKDFSQGLFEAASDFAIPLVGGDTCKGPLSISIQASGYVPLGRFVTRGGATPGDKVIVSGELGSAAVGLAAKLEKIHLDPGLAQSCEDELNRPRPRLDLIPLLREFATSAIDLSDGLVGDLAHILEQSQVGARIYKQKLPVIDWIRKHEGFDYALLGGDDYQLLFTVTDNHCEALMQKARQGGINLTIIGEIVETGYLLLDQHHQQDLSNFKGFDHFAS